MSAHSKQIRIYGLVLVFYVLSNAVVWHLYTHRFFAPTNFAGDLARLSYLSELIQPHQEKNTLPRRQIFYTNWQKESIDLITMGDSFSTGGGLGINNYYQDWMATHHNINVMNLPKLSPTVSNIETIYTLLNSGFLDEFSPKAILLEDIGREVIKEHGRQIHPLQWSSEKIKSVYASTPSTQTPSYSFLNSSNAKFLIHNLLYLFDDNALFSKVYKAMLDKPHFSHKHGNVLLFYFEDIETMSLIDDPAIALVTQNLNNLSVALAKKGITLYYMPVVDKLALYHSHLKESRYPKSTLFEQLKKHPRHYHLIDTETILSTAIVEGEQDIFFLDDTHWTWKACKRIAESIPSLNALRYRDTNMHSNKQKNIPISRSNTKHP